MWVGKRRGFDNTSGERKLNNLWEKVLKWTCRMMSKRKGVCTDCWNLCASDQTLHPHENCVLVAVHIQKELYTVILYSLLFAPWLFLKAFWKQQFISSPSRSSGGWDVITAGVIWDTHFLFSLSQGSQGTKHTLFVCVFLSRNLLLAQLFMRIANCCSPCWLCVFRELTFVCVLLLLIWVTHTMPM